MDLKLSPARLTGTVTPASHIPYAQHMIVSAALADGESTLTAVPASQDVEATIRCLEVLGARFDRQGNQLVVQGIGANADAAPQQDTELPRLDCGESRSTLYLLVPLTLVLRGGGIFTGMDRVLRSFWRPYFDYLQELGISCRMEGDTLTVQGVLTPGKYPYMESAQIEEGLLHALPLLKGDSEIVYDPNGGEAELSNHAWECECMTRNVLEIFGVETRDQEKVVVCPNGLKFMYGPEKLIISGGQTYHSANAAVEADWANAGYWHTAASLGHPLTLSGVNFNSFQYNRRIVDEIQLLDREPEGWYFGFKMTFPDIEPARALAVAMQNGKTNHLTRGKKDGGEDEFRAIFQALSALGADVELQTEVYGDPQVSFGDDLLTISGVSSLRGGATVSSCGDYRVAMMVAIAATLCEEPVILTGAECVDSVFPDFWDEYRRLGGQAEEI